MTGGRLETEDKVVELPPAGAAPQGARVETRPLVLFADASGAQRVIVSALLSDAYRVLAVSDGAAALAGIAAEPPEVILCELRLPGLDGLELLRRVKSEPRLQRIPFILVTGEERAALNSMETSADDFLSKPYGPQVLRARVAAATRSYRMYRELEAQHEELVRSHEESRRLQLELHQAQKLEAVGRLAAGIAHEINTPIQYIGDNTRFLGQGFQAMVELIARQREVLAGAPLDEAVREGLAALEQELDLEFIVGQIPPTVDRTLEGVKRVATIVRAMKEFAHPDQKEMVATDLDRALTATLEVARNEYKYVADVELDLGGLPPVTCHPGDVNQVFLNLIVNAGQAISDHLRGTSARGWIRVTTRRAGGEVEIGISDSGGGIPAAIRDKVFEPFFTTKEVGRGTGQGLAIARSVVEKLHGTIRFEVREGEGTDFVVRLPISQPCTQAGGDVRPP